MRTRATTSSPASREVWLDGQNEAFRTALNAAPLEQSLQVLIDAALALIPDLTQCAFYMASDDGKTLHLAAGMSQSYAEKVDGLAIGNESRACGLAVATGAPVLTNDVREEPRWKDWLWLAEEFDFRTCWSFPLETASGDVIGSFAWFFQEPRSQDQRDLTIARSLCGTASMIIAQFKSQAQLAAEHAATKQLQIVSTELLPACEPEALYEKLLDAAIVLMCSDAASVQLLEPDRKRLRLLASHGFAKSSARFWQWVDVDAQSSCGRALAKKERIVVGDIEADMELQGSADGEAYRASGLRAVQSTPLIARDGRLLGMISTHWSKPHEPNAADFRHFDVLARQAADLMERVLSEEALSQSEERLRKLVELMPAAVYTCDAGGRLTYYNSRAAELWGRAPTLGDQQEKFCGSFRLWTPDGQLLKHENCPMADAVKEGRSARNMEVVIEQPDGTRLVASVNIDPLYDREGQRIGAINVFQDITDSKRAAEALQTSEHHTRTLLAELQHRVRNTLAVVRSIAVRTAENTANVEDMLLHFQGRLDAFSRVQAALIRNPEGKVDLACLVTDELVAHAAREGEQVSIDGPNVRLGSKAAECLSLAVHELTTNAVKFGALMSDHGHVRVGWKTEETPKGGQFIFRWKEHGAQLKDRTLNHEGFGMELLRRSLPYDLHGETEIELESDGLRFELHMPLRAAGGPAKNEYS